MKLRDILLVAVLSLVVLGPAGVCAAKGAGVQLPEFLNPETAEYLAGDKAEVDFNSTFSAEGFFNGKLQDNIDTAVANNIPAKATVLFANAALQRNAIEASNVIYGWPCYQTYYNSEYLLVPEHDAIVGAPYTGEEMTSGLEEFAKEINAYAEEHPGLKIEVLLVDRAVNSESNAASQLVSDPFVTQKAVDILSGLCTEGNIRVASHCYQDQDAFFADFYKSDHHWNTYGVLNGMNALYGDLADDDPIKARLDKITEAGASRVDGPKFSGSCVRNGLCPAEDAPMGFAYDFSNMLIQDGDREFSGNVHSTYEEATELNKHYQFYDLYYKGGAQASGPGAENALLISDSFGSAFQWPLAECYSTLWTSNALHYYYESDERITDICDFPNCQKVIFVGSVLNFSNFLDRNPNAFK